MSDVGEGFVPSKQIHIVTYGCQMNDYESDRTFRLFHDRFGYEWNDDPNQADVVIFNTCSIREKADQKAFSEIGQLRASKLRKPDMVIAVGGCMAQMKGGEIFSRAPHVDVVFGTHQWEQLPDLVLQAQIRKRQELAIEFYGWKNYRFLPYQASSVPHRVSELVTVQNGCDKFCSFCLVPFTRGRQMSRPAEEILSEIRLLADQGVREVMLLGQNVNAYGRDRSGSLWFAQLLEQVAKVNGIERIRFMTSHPTELTMDLIECIAGEPKVCEHLHLPMQSGSDRVLRLMNRDYSINDFRDKVLALRQRVPQLSLTTDFIVGFPTETDEDFKETLRALEEFSFEDSYSFLYSPRPRTRAARWSSDFVPLELARERLAILQDRQRVIRERFDDEYVGTTQEILVEGKAVRSDQEFTGRTRSSRTVNFTGKASCVGEIVSVQITQRSRYTFKGEVC